MNVFKATAGVLLASSLLGPVTAQKGDQEQLILADCGIGDNKQHADWSTSRQMNWYQSLTWPDSNNKYPAAPNMAVEVPYKDGTYPWVSSGLSAKMPDGTDWTVFIAEESPEGANAGAAISNKNGGVTLNCWAHHGRPISAAINKTVNHDAICWSAFVCNINNQAPSRPSDQNARTSTISTVSISSTSATSQSTSPTQAPVAQSILNVDASVHPRFVQWPGTWESFINRFVWEQVTGNCVGIPFSTSDYTMTFECSGNQIHSESHMTLLLIKALHDVGMQSLWFNTSPLLPGNGNSTLTASNFIILPQAFKLTVTDVKSQKVLGSLSYKTNFNSFKIGPCVSCDTQRFNANFFDPILEAMKGTYPDYNNYRVQAVCDPWIVCY